MKLFRIFALLWAANAANAQALLPDESLEAAQARLAAIEAPSADDRFALGAIEFLRGIEKSLQFRWQHNMAIKDFDIPVLRLPVPPNSDAAPFTPDLIVQLFETLRDDMAISQAALDSVGAAEVAIELDLNAVWFDINMNDSRDDGEGMVEFGITTMMSRRQAQEFLSQPQSEIPVRFDTADVAWLNAYTHLLSGLSELVIAFDPTEAIAKVLSSNQQMMDLMAGTRPANQYNMLGGSWVDRFAMVYGALNQQPIPANTRAAHSHFLEMIRQNKLFWAAVAVETDNQREWIPNASQTAALGFELPEGAAETWQAVLNDAEMLLKGELLVSFWRVEPVGGVNVNALFENPPVVDIVDWVQGAGLLPYIEHGPTVSDRNMRLFDRMFSGDALLFAVLFN